MSGSNGLAPQCNSHAQPTLARHCASDIIKSGAYSGSSDKRQYIHNELSKPLLQSIAINPCPNTSSTSVLTSPTDKPETFMPVQMLCRSSLPLSCLDSTCFLSSRPLSRLFSAGPALLDLFQADCLDQEPTVLIVLSLADERLYAIENVLSSRGAYALCRLASWLTKRDIEVLGHRKGARDCLKTDQGMKRRMTTMQFGSKNSDWWHGAAISGVTTEPSAKKRRIGGPMLKLEMPSPRFKTEGVKVTVDILTKTPSSALLHEGKEQKMIREATPPPASLADDPKMALSVNELTNNLIRQYLDSLYLSRTSLAYFAKGPLSRLRGAAGDAECVLSLLDLTEFLRSAMLTPSLLEKKYKETLPAVIRDVYAFDDNDDEDNGNASTPYRVNRQKFGQRRKKRKVKLPKPAKNGLFPDEEEVIRKWWLSSDENLATENCNGSFLSPFRSKVEAMKVRIAALRLREIFGQVIIVLEILAIEKSSAFTDEGKKEDAIRQVNVTSDKDNQGDANCKQRRTKKKQDINLILDLLVDKLCIWRSIEQQDLSFKDSSRLEDNLPDNNASKVISPNVSGSTNLLSDFCVEVVVPFYMHRLPEVASSLSSKLGGPKASIPDKRSLKSSATSISGNQNPARPGDPAIRQVQLNQRRKIARVASDTSSRYSHPQRPGMSSRSGSAAGNGSIGGVRNRNGDNNGPRRIATLSRSATDTALPMLKFEAENGEIELSLASIPPTRRARGAGGDLISSRRQALSQCKRLSQREVDFDAMTKGKVNVLGMTAAATATSAKESGKSSSKATEDKKRVQKSKKVEAADAQLQDAISTIKKPDRKAAVGKEFEEAVERRGILRAKGKAPVKNGVNKGREKQPPQHSPVLQQTVQVTATPKHPRASAMMTMHDRHSFGEGQYTVIRDHRLQNSIPISFSSAQTGTNDRSEYQIQTQDQGQGHSQGHYVEEDGFIPSSAVRLSTSMTMAQPSLLPHQTAPEVDMGDWRQNCISTDISITNKYLNDIKNVKSTPKSISSLPPTLSLYSSTINGAIGNETPTRHPNMKRFDPNNRAYVSGDRLFNTMAAADSGIFPDTPASLSKRQFCATITNTMNTDATDEAVNPLKTITTATPVVDRVAILSTRRDNGNAQSFRPVVGRRSTFPKSIYSEPANGYINEDVASRDDTEAAEEDDVCAETPSGPGRKHRRRRYEETEEEEENDTADVLATPMKGQKWDVVSNMNAGVADRKFTRSTKTTKTTVISTKARIRTKVRPQERANATATATAVVIPVSKSSISPSPFSSSSSSLSLRSSPPSSSPLPLPAAATMGITTAVDVDVDVQAPAGLEIVPLSTPRATKTTIATAAANVVKMQQESTILASPVHDEENIYRVLGWE